jgi:hypothetical protein
VFAGRRGYGIAFLASGVVVSLIGLLFLPLVVLGCFLMVVGGALFAKSFLDE